MPIIDIHAHVYPDKIADKAAESVAGFYSIPVPSAGSVSALLNTMESSPVTHALIHSVALKPEQVQSINNFIAATCEKHPNLIGFATMHQDFQAMEEEIDRAVSLGLRGVKIHPDTQEVNMDDPRLMRLYELCEAKGLPLTIHCGDYRFDYSHPKRLQNVLHAFPKLVVDAAHFGGWSLWDLALEYLEDEGENCFLDISSSQIFLGNRRTRELCQAYGTNRILFGSDFPMWDAPKQLEAFTSLGWTDAEFEAMTWRNAERFLGMDIR